MKHRWHIERSVGRLTLSRKGNVRLDVSARTTFPMCARARLAHQIRQDMWRELRDLRGFSPVVVIESGDAGLVVTAGGEMASRSYPKAHIKAQIASVLASPSNRARWMRFANIREAADA
ncbi:hypothetical protein ACFE33_11330 [Falsihalocynthiibacter sp. SS001]|uniref:hypothetical protein n=1 Tax=Falsihalocynthiibacter sp. SS001 TaxID=3349698 RepID=UPI0036D338C5